MVCAAQAVCYFQTKESKTDFQVFVFELLITCRNYVIINRLDLNRFFLKKNPKYISDNILYSFSKDLIRSAGLSPS